MNTKKQTKNTGTPWTAEKLKHYRQMLIEPDIQERVDKITELLNHPAICADTPEEAVAYLWLTLNKVDTNKNT